MILSCWFIVDANSEFFASLIIFFFFMVFCYLIVSIEFGLSLAKFFINLK